MKQSEFHIILDSVDKIGQSFFVNVYKKILTMPTNSRNILQEIKPFPSHVKSNDHHYGSDF